MSCRTSGLRALSARRILTRPIRAVRNRVRCLAEERNTSIKSKAAAIVNRNIAGPTPVIPVTGADSAATLGNAKSGNAVNRMRISETIA